MPRLLLLALAVLCAAPLSAAQGSELVVTLARCVFTATSNNAGPVSGFMDFRLLGPATAPLGTVNVSYSVAGLSPGPHTYHVHDFGDTFLPGGESTGGHFFGDCTDCRPAGQEQSVGLLGDNANPIVPAAGGVASGHFVELVAKLNGPNSIVGRSVVIHGNAVSASARVAQCVIGRVGAQTVTTTPVNTARSATCDLLPTTAARASYAGRVTFDDVGGSATDVRFYLRGLDSQLPFYLHVHTSGNVSGTTGESTSTGGVFMGGNCTVCRGTAGLGVGHLGNNAIRYADAFGVANGYFRDSVVRLNGLNGVLGRALVLVSAASPTVVLARCVVGVTAWGAAPAETGGLGGASVVPLVTRAEALVRGASPSPMGEAVNNGTAAPVSGVVQLWKVPGVDSVRVRYSVSGLSPGNHTWYVGSAGDDCPLDGAGAGSPFVGSCADCRPDGVPDEAGRINNGLPIVADASGVAQGDFTESVIKFYGPNSVIGRSLVILGSGLEGGESEVVAYGVVGRAQEHPTLLQADRPAAYSASCRVRPTRLAGNDALDGYVSFSSVATGGVLVKFELHGVQPNSSHTWHVHQWGSVLDSASGTATGPHFNGSCVSCRPAGMLQEVGLLDDGATITADYTGALYGAFVDPHVELSGFDSVVGRSVIFHGSATDPLARIAQCVIGQVSEAAPGGGADAPPASCPGTLDDSNFSPGVSSAVCVLRPTPGNGDQGLTGTIRLAQDLAVRRANLTAEWDIEGGGLSAGTHRVSAHALGDLLGGDAWAVGPQTWDLFNFTSDGEDDDEGAATLRPGPSLNGAASLVGRALVVWGVGANATAPAAVCVVGHAQAEASFFAQPVQPRAPRVKRAVCRLRQTAAKNELEGDYPGGGWVEFTADNVDADDAAQVVSVRAFLWGLADGPHGFHVHVTGDVSNDVTASSTLGHFIGTCGGDCRPSVPQEVGNIGGGYPLYVVNGSASAHVRDAVIRLWGADSVVGRSVVVHATADPSRRILQCVIGAAEVYETEPLPPYVPIQGFMNQSMVDQDGSPDDPDDPDGSGVPDVVYTGVPYVTRATALLAPSPTAPAGSPATNARPSGLVDFRLDYATGMVEVTYELAGLVAGQVYSWAVRTYGNMCGGDGTATGEVARGSCVNGTQTVCRPEETTAANRRLGYVSASPVTAGADGTVRGRYWDRWFSFNGGQSIVGRSVVLFNDSDDAQATGVVGRLAETDARRSNQPPGAFMAACRLVPTQRAADLGYAGLSGFFEFLQEPSGGLRVEYYVSGAPPGELPFHVHTLGAVGDHNAAAGVQGHFIGYGTARRRPAGPQEVGSLGNGRPMLVASSGAAFGSFVDSSATLNGENSIVGRSVVLHAADNTRLAQCTIGVAGEDRTATTFPACRDMPANTELGVCTLQASSGSPSPSVSGRLTFALVGSDGFIGWDVHGLTPGVMHSAKVLQFGNLFQPAAAGSGSVYTGTCSNCRPTLPNTSANQRVGNLQVSLVADDSNSTAGATLDSVFRLKGVNSIVGRTLVVRRDSDLAVVAECVVGRADGETFDDGLGVAVRRARVDFVSTDEERRGGFMTFDDMGAAGVDVRFFVWGIDGSFGHEFHVHERGDIGGEQGDAVGPHFIGSCANSTTRCRPAPALEEVGLIADGYHMLTHKRVVQSLVNDRLIKLSGYDSIIGRSLVIHGGSTFTTVKVAAGVIGIEEEGPAPTYAQDPAPEANRESSPPQVLTATCIVNQTSSWIDTSGWIEFRVLPGSAGVRVRYLLHGLSPGAHPWSLHEQGDLCDDSGSSAGPSTPTVGSGVFTANALSVSQGEFVATNLTLSGASSLIGRMLVIRGTTVDPEVAAAQCVVGRSVEHPTNRQVDIPAAQYASCRLIPTWKMTSESRPVDLAGYVYFEQQPANGGVRVRFQVRNLPPGEHTWHVHTAGDLLAYDSASAALGHFVGDCDSCRPSGSPQEVGLINDGRPFTTTRFGSVRGDFVDREISLTGRNSIIGRSIVIHGDGEDPLVRVAQCVIGRRDAPDSSEDADVCPLLVKFRDPSESNSAASLSTAAIAGIAAGSFVLLLVVVGVAVMCWSGAKARSRRPEGAVRLDKAKDMELGTAAAAGGGTAAVVGTTAGTVRLPPGWEEHQDDEGNRYYYNVNTQTSVWELPPGTVTN